MGERIFLKAACEQKIVKFNPKNVCLYLMIIPTTYIGLLNTGIIKPNDFGIFGKTVSWYISVDMKM